ncbi:flagellar hook protein FlgE [Amnibacterium kyonggiense]|uniref:Flagellar hook protein FlgE n=1 Tax=Amnibacterium kyonggiense TaxID=595671 RepID=A0A4R7FR23_9MICO|nr:flagellar hook protein FlgE [Amnibacterium kyonggiense]TDS80079.1 flagellar hook protein FlgE [Amnibacterium kyonggiense]
MLRSLYSGISGLRAEQTMLDITSNNIANVNTTGFKSSSVQFEDALSQMISAAGLATTAKAGTNPNQVGLGVRVAGVRTNLTEGSQTTTGNNLDAMISGDGYFVTQTGSQTLYTRNGSFHWDSQGRLSTADGSLVQGWNAVNGTVSTGGKPTTLTLPSGTVAPAKATSLANMTGNLPSDAADGTQFQRDITVFSADGTARQLTVTFTAQTATKAGQWGYSVADGKLPDGTTTAPVTGTLQTDGSGQITGSNLAPTIDGIKVDLSKMSGYANLTTAGFDKQDGNAAGTLLAVSMGGDGTLSGTFSNGATVAIARLAIGTFTNPEGLAKAGNSFMTETLNSGTVRLGTAGADGYGAVVSGALEASNVDLSQEFTNLIVAQRGFQANARIITTSDEILQELTQLKR